MATIGEICPFTRKPCRGDCQWYLFPDDRDDPDALEKCMFYSLGENIRRIADTLDRLATTEENRRMEGN